MVRVEITDTATAVAPTEYDDLSVYELRLEVNKRLGVNEDPGTPFSKRAINSGIAYFLGEFACYPENVYNPDRSPTKESMHETLAVAMADYIDHDVIRAAVEGWIERLDHAPGYRPFNRTEITAMLVAMDECGDCRGWVE